MSGIWKREKRYGGVSATLEVLYADDGTKIAKVYKYMSGNSDYIMFNCLLEDPRFPAYGRAYLAKRAAREVLEAYEASKGPAFELVPDDVPPENLNLEF